MLTVPRTDCHWAWSGSGLGEGVVIFDHGIRTVDNYTTAVSEVICEDIDHTFNSLEFIGDLHYLLGKETSEYLIGGVYIRGHAEKIPPDGSCDPIENSFCFPKERVLFRSIEVSKTPVKLPENSEDGSVILGCLENGEISAATITSDLTERDYLELPWQEVMKKEKWTTVKIPREETKKILASTKENPVMLRFERKPVFGGSGAPGCLSPFSKIEIME